MSSSDGGAGVIGEAIVGGSEPEKFVDRAEARLADEHLNLAGEARHVLREVIHGGINRASGPERALAQNDLEQSLDQVITEFVSVMVQREVDEVDPETFKAVWDAVCIYPWCRH